MLDCTYEEADTRVIVHWLHALEYGQSKIEIRTVDTDIVVLLIGQFFYVQDKYPLVDIWVAFGVGKHFQNIHVNSVCGKLGKELSQSFPAFHAFSSCDTTSSFCGKGKKTALQTWRSFPEATEAFLYMQQNPFVAIDHSSPHFQTLERLTVLILSDQLDDTKNNTMEGICEALADELKEVQQIHLKIQLKKRKQQQQGRHQPKANQVQNQSAERRWREQLNRQLCQTSIKE
ncbi:hypothetical protein ACROYT_G005321 [Oculina patagonica]